MSDLENVQEFLTQGFQRQTEQLSLCLCARAKLQVQSASDPQAQTHPTRVHRSQNRLSVVVLGVPEVLNT